MFAYLAMESAKSVPTLPRIVFEIGAREKVVARELAKEAVILRGL